MMRMLMRPQKNQFQTRFVRTYSNGSFPVSDFTARLSAGYTSVRVRAIGAAGGRAGTVSVGKRAIEGAAAGGGGSVEAVVPLTSFVGIGTNLSYTVGTAGSAGSTRNSYGKAEDGVAGGSTTINLPGGVNLLATGGRPGIGGTLTETTYDRSTPGKGGYGKSGSFQSRDDGTTDTPVGYWTKNPDSNSPVKGVGQGGTGGKSSVINAAGTVIAARTSGTAGAYPDPDSPNPDDPRTSSLSATPTHATLANGGGGLYVEGSPQISWGSEEGVYRNWGSSFVGINPTYFPHGAIIVDFD